MSEGFDHIDDLIGKYLTGEATAQERAELDQWIAASESNQRYFAQVRLIFDKATDTPPTHSFDVDAAWSKMASKMKGQGGRSVSFHGYWSVLRVAAVLLVSVGLGYSIYNSLKQPTVTLALSADKTIVKDSLPDGSFAVLNKASSIEYTFNPSSNKRIVTLKGEAFFEVKHDEEKPFIIEAGDVIIEDVGTTFNVTATPDSPTVEVFVETGEVAFYTLKDKGLNLTAGETGIYDRTTQSFSRSLKIDTNRLAYKTGIFTFHNATLGSIIDDLNSVYDAKVKLGNEALSNCRLNVAFRNERIEDIVMIIAETLSLSVREEGGDYVLDGISCSD